MRLPKLFLGQLEENKELRDFHVKESLTIQFPRNWTPWQPSHFPEGTVRESLKNVLMRKRKVVHLLSPTKELKHQVNHCDTSAVTSHLPWLRYIESIGPPIIIVFPAAQWKVCTILCFLVMPTMTIAWPFSLFLNKLLARTHRTVAHLPFSTGTERKHALTFRYVLHLCHDFGLYVRLESQPSAEYIWCFFLALCFIFVLRFSLSDSAIIRHPFATIPHPNTHFLFHFWFLFFYF